MPRRRFARVSNARTSLSRNPRHGPALAAAGMIAAAVSAPTAHGQVRILLADRTAGAIWCLTDRNGDGMIDATEIRRFYDATNAAGTPGVLNPNSLGMVNGRFAVVGDQDTAARHWLVLVDRDFNGDAQGAGESFLGATRDNLSGASFAFPVGFAASADGPVYLGNAGNTFGPDQIYVGDDLNDDNDLDDAGEVIGWVTINGFGTNGAFSPQEIVFGADGALYLRNSSANQHGIFRLADTDESGLIDRAEEFTLFWGAGNAAGITPSAGFAIDVDPTRPRSFFTLQLATGGVDVLVRCTDLDGDGDAMDAGESAIVFTTAEAGFTSVDALALPDGRVLISDNSGNRIIALRDLDGDGLFMSPGERVTFLDTTPGILAARGMVIYPCPGDFNRDMSTDPDDLGDFINCYFAMPPCDGADFNDDGAIDPDDLGDFINVYFSEC